MGIEKAVTIADVKRLARKRTPQFVFMTLETAGGEGDGVRANVEAFSRYRLASRALAHEDRPDISVNLFETRYSAPFGIAPIGRAGSIRRNADQMLAAAAAGSGLPYVLSGLSCASIEQISSLAPGATWSQIYPARNPRILEDMIARARDCGIMTLVLTVDVPAPMYNHWLARRGISLSGRVPPANWPYMLAQAVSHPRWMWEHGSRGGLPPLESVERYFPDAGSATETARNAFSEMLCFKTWQVVERVRRAWGGALVIKGIMTTADADRSAELGADAIVVSNHGGNKADVIASSLCALAEIARDRSATVPLIFDGGIRRGSDIAIALALGASFCLVGRAALYGAMAAGEAGARRAIDILSAEFLSTLVMTGCATALDLRGMLRHERPSEHTMGTDYV